MSTAVAVRADAPFLPADSFFACREILQTDRPSVAKFFEKCVNRPFRQALKPVRIGIDSYFLTL
ncbi:hypothetical protein GCM10011430_12590 [Oxalicibacterium solurbis]|uniref:Uncharacterized protein n=1 Tax=Oxalicibacterium solurbis TaxID=69280 RepID=A0A8J3AVL6_9BURK|nr:hypothetical protein GCM10011430_12590 [Oxalicibacterium solurbis]